MKRLQIIILIIGCSFLSGADKVAMTIKAKGDAVLQRSDETEKKPLKPGNPVQDQDKISTGKKSMAMIMFLDDKSVLKIREDSEFTVGGQRTTDGISKSVDLSYGVLRANVSPQEGKQFIISTPTSVASIKGTEIIVSSDPTGGDVFILLEGLVDVENSVSGEITSLSGGETAISSTTGELETHTTTEEELESTGGDEEEEIRELRFQFEDDSGNTKELIIKFTE
ncbi:MAG: FecR domain-containing protein [Fidelibacterota bacterium]